MPGQTKYLAGQVGVRRRTRANFMKVLMNEICLSCVCAEGTTPFSAVAQRLKIGGIKVNRILIIEDEVKTATPVKEALELNGMQAEIAKDGEIGLKMVKEKEFDLILLDLKMPKMSGEDVLREIRKIRPYVFVIIYTNFSDFTDLKVLANIGIDGYVNKGPDADLKELINIIKEKLEPFSIESMQNIVNSAKMQEEG